MTPVERNGCVYCTEACYQRVLVERAERKRVEGAAMDRLERFALEHYPGITITRRSAYASTRAGVVELRETHVYFTFPGSRIGDASLTLKLDDKSSAATVPFPSLLVCNGDIAAWNAYRGMLAPAAPPTDPTTAINAAASVVRTCDEGRK